MTRSRPREAFAEFVTTHGARIFRFPLEAFPGFWANVYLVVLDDFQVLIDTGSGFGESNQHLEAGFERASAELGRSIQIQDLTHLLITHGHIDHIGGLTFLTEESNALVGIHELDRRILTNYEERLIIVSQRLDRYLTEAGVPPSRRENLLEMYNLPKALFSSVKVDFTYENLGMRLGPFEFLHVPGHCAGHVVIRLHDFLFSGDHILSEISPHQAPEHLTLFTGLGHYLQSLDDVIAWSGKIKLTLGGHRKPIEDLGARIAEIKAEHADRLKKVCAFVQEPRTIVEISHHLFGNVSGYNVLLALEEAGAHVEYLYQRGHLAIDNVADLSVGHELVPIYYRQIT